MTKTTLLILTSLLINVAFLRAEKGYVLKVSDGDTAVIENSNTKDKVKCRLYGIDAPEKDMPFGPESRNYLANMILSTIVEYQVKATDRYGRSVCEIYSGDLDVNKEMVSYGMAWVYIQYLKKDKQRMAELIKEQEKAISNRYGVWQDENPQPPWEYRKNKRIKQKQNE